MSNFQKYFVDVYKNSYADFSGRARRSEYWYFQLFLMLIIFGISILFSLLGDTMGIVGSGIIFIFSLISIPTSLALVTRRLHDIGKSGWWYFIGIIPLVGAIILLVYLCTDSQTGQNQYGPNPKEEGDEITDFLISDQ